MKNQFNNLNSLKITGSIVVVLAVLNLIGSNLLATKGHEVEKLTQQTQSLQKENSYLGNQIATKSSLSYIEEQALTLGFQKISQPIALTAPAPVAMLTR
jgi:hypothetical protein